MSGANASLYLVDRMVSAEPRPSVRERGVSDLDLRTLVKARLAPILQNTSAVVLIEELGLCRGQARVDLALVNGRLHGFEIKSDQDSLRRLPAQAKIYATVLERATLVTTVRHVDRALGILPRWWEVLVAKVTGLGHLTLNRVRRGRLNPDVDPRAMAELLWYEDAISLLRAHGAQRGVLRKPRSVVWDRICDRLQDREIRSAVLDALKARRARPFARPLS